MSTATHVEVPSELSTPLSTISINNDDIGYVQLFDFSKANLNQESRIAAISTVASVCYQNPKASGSISLYNRLSNESAGLPSSSFEFVPVLIDLGPKMKLFKNLNGKGGKLSTLKYGEFIMNEVGASPKYLLTNLRALLDDVGESANEFYNTPEECEIIAKHFHVFQTKIDLATARQFMRHRVIWQELSRRYVSGSKKEFQFYISPRMKDLHIDHDTQVLSTQKLIDLCTQHYFEALTLGVKPEEARRILPQCMYTTIWSAWMPSQFDSFLKLRLDSHTQVEHRHLASAMQELVNTQKV